MSVELAYEDPLLSTGRTIELVTPSTISVDLTSSELGVSLDLTVLSSVSLELSIEQSLISVELSTTPILFESLLKNPILDWSGDVLQRIDYDSGIYKIFSWTNGVLMYRDLHTSTEVTRKTFNYTDGVLTSISEAVV
jgi:hypothetical protein